MSRSPGLPPVDPRAVRFDQGVLAIALLGAFVFDAPWVVPLWTVVYGLGVVAGPRAALFPRLFADYLAPRLGPPPRRVDPRPHRFAALATTGVLVAASLLVFAGTGGLAWIVALALAAVAGLAATTGICAWCELHARLEGRGIIPPG